MIKLTNICKETTAFYDRPIVPLPLIDFSNAAQAANTLTAVL